MTKIILIKDESLWKKVGVLCSIFFKDVSVTEHMVLTEIVAFSDGVERLNIQGEISKQIAEKLSIPQNSFNVHVMRLAQKGAILKTNGIVCLHPAFNELISQDSIMIRFKNDPAGGPVTG